MYIVTNGEFVFKHRISSAHTDRSVVLLLVSWGLIGYNQPPQRSCRTTIGNISRISEPYLVSGQGPYMDSGDRMAQVC